MMVVVFVFVVLDLFGASLLPARPGTSGAQIRVLRVPTSDLEYQV